MRFSRRAVVASVAALGCVAAAARSTRGTPYSIGVATFLGTYILLSPTPRLRARTLSIRGADPIASSTIVNFVLAMGLASILALVLL